MKYIVRIVVSLFALVLAAACYNNEIDNPDNLQDPEQSGLRITATMAKTRVSYGNETDAQLLPVWEPYDILFGFYVDKSNNIKNFILEVVGISAKDGISSATLGFVEGQENGLADQPVNTPVHLIYTGKNGDSSIEEDTDIFSEDGKFSVDLTTQNLERVPVCMSATAGITEGTDDVKTLTFNFAYDCAVLEIESLRGFKEDNSKSATSISKIEVTNLVLGGTYTYDTEEGFRFVPNNSTDTYSFEGLAKWSVNADGKLVYDRNQKGFLIAAAPNSLEKEIDINVYDDTSSQSPYFTHHCESTTINAGRCYVVRSEEVVAKTSDGLYFTTVKAAFDRAKELSEDNSGNFNTAATNIVTLLAPEIFGLGTTDSGWWKNNDIEDGEYIVETVIDIDYPVSFNLNGCCLDLGYDGGIETTGGFSVKEGGCLNVTDNTGEGAIYSDSRCPMIENFGTVNILNGYFEMFGKDTSNKPLIKNSHILNVFGGELFGAYAVTIECTGGTLTVGNEDSQTKDDDEIVIKSSYGDHSAITCSGGTVNMNYGKIEGNSTVSAIVLNNGAVGNISGGTLNAQGAPTIIFTDTETKGIITGGVISNKCKTNYRSFDTIHVFDGADCKISGGAICGESDSAGAVLCVSSSTDHPSTLTVTWPNDISDPSPETIQEPIFYSKGSNDSAVPICAYYLGVNNTAKLIINGGYLISSNPSGLFYIDDDKNTDLDNLCVKDENSNVVFGNFYSNVSKINMDGHNFDPNDFIDFKSVTISEIQFMGSQYKDYEEDEPSEKYGSIRLPFSDTPEFIGDLYKIFSYSETP